VERVPIVREVIRWVERSPMRIGNSRLRVFERDAADGARLRVIVGREPIGPAGAVQWHMSISSTWVECHRATPDRYPTWDEVAEARERYLPDELTFAMILPPRSEYVNLHATTFHLHEVPS
jgi:hypothetical protein